jgi:hypothetical protein
MAVVLLSRVLNYRANRVANHGRDGAGAADDRYLLLRDARELVEVLEGLGRHDQVAVVRLERWLRARGEDEAADRVV